MPLYRWRLNEIRAAVTELHFKPIEPRDFGIPRGTDRHFSLELLSKCRLAIIEVSVRNGWHEELGRCVDENRPTLCLYQYTKKGKIPHISGMSTSTIWFKTNSKGYNNPEELNDAVWDFLCSF